MIASLWRRLPAVLRVLLLSGWFAAHAADPLDRAPVTATAIPTTPLDPNSSAPESYRLRSGDTIEVRVYQEEDLTTKTRIDPEGFVLLPLIGRVAVKGLTVASATTLIRGKLEADFLYEARTSVLLVDRAAEHFLMMGQVSRPGVYDIPPGEQIDLLRAIAMAGGFTKIANQGKIVVKRTSGGTEEFLRLNAKNLAKSATEQPFFVHADDQITIGESAF